MIGYLNINSLQNKLTDLRVILKYLSLNYFVLSETKLNESFANAQFTLDGYEIRTGRVEINLEEVSWVCSKRFDLLEDWQIWVEI